MSSASVFPRPPEMAHRRSVRMLHTSDVHVGRDADGYSGFGTRKAASVAELQRLIDLAHRQRADLMLISGDFFDHNRIDAELAGRTAALLHSAGMPVVILPGNHDPYTADSVYRRHAFPDNVHILTKSTGELTVLPELAVQVWGQAHTDYHDFAPVARCPDWIDRDDSPLWRVVMAHGLYVRSDYETRLSYRIHSHELDALQAHYVGLGHLEHHEQVGYLAYYAGAPDREEGATLIELAPAGVSVRHVKFEPSPATACEA